MIECKCKEIVTLDGEAAEQFSLSGGGKFADGIYVGGVIYVHTISAKDALKEIMNVLVARFGSNRVVFTPLVNDNIKNAVRGVVKVCRADDSKSPYGEDFEYMECEWEPQK